MVLQPSGDLTEITGIFQNLYVSISIVDRGVDSGCFENDYIWNGVL